MYRVMVCTLCESLTCIIPFNPVTWAWCSLHREVDAYVRGAQ